MSHALAIAHFNDLTHGKFNLSQVIIESADETLDPTFKVTSFRPWLVDSNTPSKSGASHLQMAKCKDVFAFGNSLFDLMIGKKSENEKF